VAGVMAPEEGGNQTCERRWIGPYLPQREGEVRAASLTKTNCNAAPRR
jgi:hypothetical protein